MKLYLIVAKGKQKGVPIRIPVDLFLIGSEKMCQLRSRLPNIGGKHCALVKRGKKIFVRDMDSGEPTILNGNTLPAGGEWPCHTGDRLEVGPLEFMIQFREAGLAQKDLEEWAASCLDSRDDRKLLNDGADNFHTASNASEFAAAILNKMALQKGVAVGRLRVAKEAGLTIVRFNDEYLVEEAEIAFVKQELFSTLENPSARVLLDFKVVSRMSTTAVKMIEEVRNRLQVRGTAIALCRVRSELREMMEMMGLSKVPIFHDKKLAMSGKW